MGVPAVDSISFNFLDSEGSSERDTGGASRGEASRCYRISIYARPWPWTGLVTVPLHLQQRNPTFASPFLYLYSIPFLGLLEISIPLTRLLGSLLYHS